MRLLNLLLLLACLTSCSAIQPHSESTADDAGAITISVVGTNDIHGALLGSAGGGGMELLSGYISNLRAARANDGGALLLIDAGDMWQGTLESNLTEGASVVAAFNALGYTAAAFGNHEFDFGPEGPAAVPIAAEDDPQGAMKQRAREAHFPFLAANLIDANSGRPVAWDNVMPSVMVNAAGIEVGIIGVMTERAFQATILANTRGLRVDPIVETVVEHARRLRADGAAIVIVTAHAGSRCTEFHDPYDISSCNAQGEIFEVANALPAGLVDVIIGGHAHAGIAHFVNGIAVTSAFSRNRAFDRIDLRVNPVSGALVARRIFPPQLLCRFLTAQATNCATQRHPDVPLAAAMYADKPVVPDPAVTDAIAAAVEQAHGIKMEQVGVHLQSAFLMGSIPESAVGNLLMDALLDSAEGADIAIHNSRGGIRAPLPAGDLLYGSLYEMFPFDNRMLAIELSGAELRRIMHQQMTSPNWRAGISGATVVAECDGQQLDVRLIRPSGVEITDEETLRIVTADFLLSGGDDIFVDVIPAGGIAPDHSAPLIRDVVRDWLRKRGGTLDASMFHDENKRRFVYDTPPPIDCN